ncbi:MAG: AAA family ATPase [Myxococcales bacterium]|nr:AAA family ATPase [Myxococcales bacterium]
MELMDMIDALTRPQAYAAVEAAAGATEVEVIQTHISVVFLVGEAVIKLKKPVRLPFLDYSTLALRRRYCEAEVELNRRLAPDVYRGVVTITADGDGLRVGGDGEVVDYAVEMRRLDEAVTLEGWLARDALPSGAMSAIGRRLAAFHRHAARGPEISALASFDAVAKNCRDNFSQTAELGLEAIPTALLDLLAARTDAALAAQEATIRGRAARDVACDCHGDLRLDHVYLFPDRAPPRDLEIIDCIEFNDAFRYGDPVVDLAFLVMDLEYHGRPTLAVELVDAYFAAAGDPEGAALLPLYTSYRASVRGKVEAFRMREPEVPAAEREASRRSALRHFLLALRELSELDDAPALLLIAGLPGSGKSTIAKGLAGPAHAPSAAVIRSDVTRKRLAGLDPEDAGKAAPGAGIYTAEMTQRTYAACLDQARAHLLRGRPVIVDANFKADAQRRPFADLAAELGVPFALLLCEASEEETLARLAARRGDASDADAAIFFHARREWEALADDLRERAAKIDSSGAIEGNLAAARRALRAIGFHTPSSQP